MEYFEQAELIQYCIRGFDSYASDDEWPRLEKRDMRDSVEAASKNLHLKLQIGRNILSTDVSLALKRSKSEDGAATYTTKTSNKGAFNEIKGPMQRCKSVASRVGEGSWSQSKRWMSQETKERMAFHKTMQNLHHIGATNSPFIPQTPLELTALRAEMAEIRKRRLSRKVEWRTATLGRRKAIAQGLDEQDAKLVPLLQGKKFPDNLSTVFASRNCFSEYVCHDDAQSATWPSLAELKEVGDKRSGRHERYLPLPKLSMTVKGYATCRQAYSCSANDANQSEMGAVKVDTRFMNSVSPANQTLCPRTTEMDLEELPAYLQKAIVEMEKELDD
ncbi:uncharacterized protein MAM_06202 [Metarhizium album ARSEF 1941]|uniref:Uncharacterized protein n=1 Tax=Metarhizium album (strain ARSEF 1941) TaxID=1081103 RepID=A0A0B2WSB3_METAS|nr:uncharacterized protein MAM_06202 [Metarhizium album ARSEF 1941]KHN95840.1 hypothetical protein MAM_06202 [Metarhizium album ARSEF 1941]